MRKVLVGVVGLTAPRWGPRIASSRINGKLSGTQSFNASEREIRGSSWAAKRALSTWQASRYRRKRAYAEP
jgi:hypothetical protein